MPPKKIPRLDETHAADKAQCIPSQENDSDKSQKQSVSQQSRYWKHSKPETAEQRLLRLATNAARKAKDRGKLVKQGVKCARTLLEESRERPWEGSGAHSQFQSQQGQAAVSHPPSLATTAINRQTISPTDNAERTIATFNTAERPTIATTFNTGGRPVSPVNHAEMAAGVANRAKRTVKSTKMSPPSEKPLLTVKLEPEDEHSTTEDLEPEVRFEPRGDRETGRLGSRDRPAMPLVKLEMECQDEEQMVPRSSRETAPSLTRVKVEREEEEEDDDDDDEEEGTEVWFAEEQHEQPQESTENDQNGTLAPYKVLWELSLDKESESEGDEAEDEEQENNNSSSESDTRNNSIPDPHKATRTDCIGFHPENSHPHGSKERGEGLPQFVTADPASIISESEEWLKVVSGSMGSASIPSFSQLTGMQVRVPGEGSPKDFFELFMDEQAVDLFVTETNRYADQVKAAIPSFFYLKKWEKTDRVEMRKFIALLLAMGIFGKAEVRQYWSTHPVLETPFFRKVMPRDRFLALLAFWHLNDNNKMPARGTGNYDKIFKVRKLYDHLDDRFQHVYYPEQILSVAESVMPCKDGTTSCQQFVPCMQQTQPGVKIYFCCESSSGYVCSMKLCPEHETGQGRMDCLGSSSDIVEDIASDYVNKGHVARGVEKFELSMNMAAFSRRTMKWWKRAAVFLLNVAKGQAYVLYKKVKNSNMSQLDFTTDLILGLTNGLGTCQMNSPPPLSDPLAGSMPGATSRAGFQPSPNPPACLRLGPGTVPMQFERLEFPQYDHFLEVIPRTGKTAKPTKNCVCCTLWCGKRKSYVRRRSTRYQCTKCKVALCIEPCHRVFHTVKDYKRELGLSCDVQGNEDAVYALTVKVI